MLWACHTAQIATSAHPPKCHHQTLEVHVVGQISEINIIAVIMVVITLTIVNQILGGLVTAQFLKKEEQRDMDEVILYMEK